MGDRDLEREILQHAELVRIHAGSLRKQLPFVAYEELVVAGTTGLWQALKRYDNTRHDNFSLYAARRVRGAMLDWVRSMYGDARYNKVGRTLHESYCEALMGRTYRLNTDQIHARIDLERSFGALPPSQREVVQRYYFGGEDFSAIAKSRGVTKSAPVQQKNKALRTLAQVMGQ